MNKVMLCKELLLNEDTKNEVRYYKVPEELRKEVLKGKFIFIVNKETEKQNVGIFQIITEYDLVNSNQQISIAELSESEKIHLVCEDLFFCQSIQITEEYYNYTIEQLRQFFNLLIKDLKCKISDLRKKSIHNKNKRINYLLKIFSDKSLNEFNKTPKRYKNKWLTLYNNYELDFIHIINLYYLKQTICNLIEMNKTISNTNKKSLKCEYLNELEMICSSIEIESQARYQSEKYIGVDSSSDGKCIVFGKMTCWECNISFISIWNIIKNLLTVSLAPILIVLLDSNKKIIIYCLLAIVYIIALILSDEKQTDNIIIFINQIKSSKEEKTNYDTLFYFGLTVVFTFIIFSFQIVYVPTIIESVKDFITYLIGDILLGFTTLFLLLTLITAFFWLSTSISSKMFYIRRSEKFNAIFLFCFKTIFWLLSDYCIFYIFLINKCFYNWQPLWKFFLYWIVFGMALILSLQKIVGNIREFKKDIKD